MKADTASENTAAGATARRYARRPTCGFITVTVGGFVSAGGVVENVTSTQ